MKNIAIAVLVCFGMVTIASGQVCPPVIMQPCSVTAVTDFGMPAPAIYCTNPIVQDPVPARQPELTSVVVPGPAVVQEGSAVPPISVLSSPAPEFTMSPEVTLAPGPEVRSGSRRSVNNTGMRRRSGVIGRFLNRFR